MHSGIQSICLLQQLQQQKMNVCRLCPELVLEIQIIIWRPTAVTVIEQHRGQWAVSSLYRGGVFHFLPASCLLLM
jgi:hypothetical protein